MKVSSPLANMDIGIGEVRRSGNDLVMKSRPGGSMDVEIRVSAAEVLRTVGHVLATPSGLVFVLALPFFWLRQRLGRGPAEDAAAGGTLPSATDVNKPW